MRHLPTFESVVNDLESHKLDVKLDSESFKQFILSKGNSIDYFEITTWPYHLAISDDRGCYVFSRYGSSDMMSLFRRDPKNLDFKYISEKCVAVDRQCRISDYDPSRVKEYLNYYIEDNEDSLPESAIEQIRSELIEPYFEFEFNAREAVENFFYHADGQIHRPFQDFWEVNLSTYNYNYVWCVYAIIWAVGVYDKKW